MSATAAICQFTTKPVRKLGRSSPLPLYQQISMDSGQISAATFICWDQGKFPHTRPSAGVPSNLCRIRANFCNRGHLPVWRQVWMDGADFHDRGYLPVCYQDFIGSGQIFTTAAICHYATKFVWSLKKFSATSAVWADFHNRGLLYHQISMWPKQISAIAVIWLYITLTVLIFHRFFIPVSSRSVLSPL